MLCKSATRKFIEAMKQRGIINLTCKIHLETAILSPGARKARVISHTHLGKEITSTDQFLCIYGIKASREKKLDDVSLPWQPHQIHLAN